MLLLMLPKLFSLLDKDFILPNGSIRLLQFHIWNCVSVLFMLLLMLTRTYTPLYIKEQGRTFFHTMNTLIVQQHHQNIQMRSKNITLNQILATVGVNVPLHIPYVPGIASLTKISTTSTFEKHIHLHMITFIGICYLKRKKRKNWFQRGNILFHLLYLWIQIVN